MKKNIARIIAFLLIIAMLAGCGFYLVYMIADGSTGFTVYAASDADAYRKLEELKNVIDNINKNYKDKISVEELVDGAYSGVFDKLDNWSVYFSTVEAEKQFTSTIEAGDTYEGVGLTITKDAGRNLVESVNVHGPARDAGIRYGDYIVSVDGKNCENWSLDDLVAKLRGKAGTKVTVGIERAGQLLSFELVRREITMTEIDAKIIDGTDIGYIQIASFSSGVYWDFLSAYFTLMSEGATNLIIDVRNNGGGLMDEAMNCAAALLKPGDEVLTFKNSEGVVETYTVIGETQPYPDNRYIVLVNENTASASEAFACALKENKAATLVGIGTYGKGCAQQIIDIDDTSSFKLSTMYFVGPNGKQIDKVGVAPDYVVYNNAGMTLAEAYALVSKIVPMSEQNKKYLKIGEYGINVLAAQGRLKAMGYSVDTTGIMDTATMEALKVIQKNAGGYPYGGLDFFTQKAIVEAFDSWLYADGDAQLAKAIELFQ